MLNVFKVDLQSALLLCRRESRLPKAKDPTLVAVSEPTDWLSLRLEPEGYVLQAGRTEFPYWPDVFGVVPYGGSRVALREDKYSPWLTARQNAAEYEARMNAPTARHPRKPR